LLVGSFEVLLQSGVLWARLLQLVNRNRVRHCLNKTPVFTRGDDIEWLEPKLEAVLDEDVFELRNHLRGELLLFQIVTTFDNAAD
jgi:hypothetical protein